jgi:uncharacterized protein involved in outer membrane biogenesis
MMSGGMRKWTRLALIAGGGVALLLGGLTLAVSSLLESGAVRDAIEAQATAALGKPVRIGTLGAGVFPRIALRLERVSVGQPPEIAFERARVATGLGGLLRGRVEEAEVVLEGARLRLPLARSDSAPGATPPAAPPTPRPAPLPAPTAAPSPAPGAREPAFTIASVRTVKVEDLQIEAAGRTVRLDVAASLEGERLEVTRLDLTADGSEIRGTASLASWRALDGTFSIDAETLDLDGLLAFVAALSPPGPPAAEARRSPALPSPGPATAAPSPRSAPAAGAPLARRLDGKIRAASGTYQGIAFRDLAGELSIRGQDVALAPVQVELLGGRYDGKIALGVADGAARVVHEGRLQEIDLAQASAALGSPGTASGTLHFDLSLAGSGATLEAAARRSAGAGAVRIARLRLRDLDLLRTALAFLGEGAEAARDEDGASQLTATLAIADERITSQDLRLESPDFELRGKGALGFRGALDVAADLIASEALSSRVRGTAARYAKEGGRLVVPMKVGGRIENPSVAVDAAALVRRAAGVGAGEAGKKIEDKLREELSKFFRRGK